MKILKDVGLSERESEIYTLLLRLGESPISSIQKATGAHPQVVYRVIDNLVAKGLVNVIRRDHRKYVSAESPKRLEQIAHERLVGIRDALPELIALQQPTRQTIVRTSRGDEAVRALRSKGIDSLKKGDTYFIISGSGDRFYKVMGERHAEIERKRIKKGVWRKMIAFESERNRFAKDTFRELTEFRYLPEEYPVTSSTNIFANTVAIIIWAIEPIVITLESREVAEQYRKYFSHLWRVANQ